MNTSRVTVNVTPAVDVTAVADRLLPDPAGASEGDTVKLASGAWSAATGAAVKVRAAVVAQSNQEHDFAATSPGDTALDAGSLAVTQELPSGVVSVTTPGFLNVGTALAGPTTVTVSVSMSMDDARTCELYLTANGAEVGERATRHFTSNKAGVSNWSVALPSVDADTDFGVSIYTTDSTSGKTYTTYLIQMILTSYSV